MHLSATLRWMGKLYLVFLVGLLFFAGVWITDRADLSTENRTLLLALCSAILVLMVFAWAFHRTAR